MKTPAEVVSADLKKIKAADGVIAYLPETSIGTTMEIFYNSVTEGRGRNSTIILGNGVPADTLNYFRKFGHVVELKWKGEYRVVVSSPFVECEVPLSAMKETKRLADKDGMDRVELPYKLERVKDSEGVVVDLKTGTTPRKIMTVFYNSHQLGRGPEKTHVVAHEHQKRHPWIRHLSTQYDSLAEATECLEPKDYWVIT